MFDSVTAEPTIHEQFKRNLASKQAWRYKLSLALFVGAATCFVTSLTCLEDVKRSNIFFFAFLVCWCTGSYFRISWKRCNLSATVVEAIQDDPRPPILYLRPFKADGIRFKTSGTWVSRLKVLIFTLLLPFPRDLDIQWSKRRGEELLVDILDPIGPVIAIGRPGEHVPKLGAARIYVGDEWQDVVQKYLEQSQLLLMFAGTTPSFGWELKKVFSHRPFVPILLILPFFHRYRQQTVDKFREMLEEASGLKLSNDLRKIRAVYFMREDAFVELAEKGSKEERLLNAQNPFLGSLAQMMELSRPGWSIPFVDAARAERRENRLWVSIGIPVLLVLLGWRFYILKDNMRAHPRDAAVLREEMQRHYDNDPILKQMHLHVDEVVVTNMTSADDFDMSETLSLDGKQGTFRLHCSRPDGSPARKCDPAPGYLEAWMSLLQ